MGSQICFSSSGPVKITVSYFQGDSRQVEDRSLRKNTHIFPEAKCNCHCHNNTPDPGNGQPISDIAPPPAVSNGQQGGKAQVDKRAETRNDDIGLSKKSDDSQRAKQGEESQHSEDIKQSKKSQMGVKYQPSTEGSPMREKKARNTKMNHPQLPKSDRGPPEGKNRAGRNVPFALAHRSHIPQLRDEEQASEVSVTSYVDQNFAATLAGRPGQSSSKPPSYNLSSDIQASQLHTESIRDAVRNFEQEGEESKARARGNTALRAYHDLETAQKADQNLLANWELENIREIKNTGAAWYKQRENGRQNFQGIPRNPAHRELSDTLRRVQSHPQEQKPEQTSKRRVSFASPGISSEIDVEIAEYQVPAYRVGHEVTAKTVYPGEVLTSLRSVSKPRFVLAQRSGISNFGKDGRKVFMVSHPIKPESSASYSAAATDQKQLGERHNQKRLPQNRQLGHQKQAGDGKTKMAQLSDIDSSYPRSLSHGVKSEGQKSRVSWSPPEHGRSKGPANKPSAEGQRSDREKPWIEQPWVEKPRSEKPWIESPWMEEQSLDDDSAMNNKSWGSSASASARSSQSPPRGRRKNHDHQRSTHSHHGRLQHDPALKWRHHSSNRKNDSSSEEIGEYSHDHHINMHKPWGRTPESPRQLDPKDYSQYFVPEDIQGNRVGLDSHHGECTARAKHGQIWYSSRGDKRDRDDRTSSRPGPPKQSRSSRPSHIGYQNRTSHQERLSSGSRFPRNHRSSRAIYETESERS